MVRCASPAVSDGTGVDGTDGGGLEEGGRGEGGGTAALSSGSMTSAMGLLMACLAPGVAKGVWNDCCVCSGVV